MLAVTMLTLTHSSTSFAEPRQSRPATRGYCLIAVGGWQPKNTPEGDARSA